MFGGLITLVGLALERLTDRALRWSAVMVSAMIFVTVVVSGYYIEFHETVYGMGNPHAPRAVNDAVFTWWHQDFAFFLLPAVLAVLLAMQRLHLPLRTRQTAGTSLIGGSVIAFLGGMDYIFVNPATYGPAFVVAAIGFFFVVIGLAIALWALAKPPTPVSESSAASSPHQRVS
jgi:hypothetical protein